MERYYHDHDLSVAAFAATYADADHAGAEINNAELPNCACEWKTTSYAIALDSEGNYLPSDDSSNSFLTKSSKNSPTSRSENVI